MDFLMIYALIAVPVCLAVVLLVVLRDYRALRRTRTRGTM